MTGGQRAGLPAAVLPRSGALTDLLVAPAPGGRDAPGALVTTVRERIEAGLARVTGHGRPVPGGAVRRGRVAVDPRSPRTCRVTAYALRTAALAPERLVAPTPFRWTAQTARRSIGLAAVRSCTGGAAGTPVATVAGAVASLAADGRHGLGRPGSLTEWIGGLSGPARALVEAEAVTWATRLWTSVQWDRLGPAARVGEPDARWSPMGTPGISLQGRADVRAGGVSAPCVLLTTLAGRPGPTSRVELGLAALVDLLSAAECQPGEAAARLPRRVVGWWPECGRALAVGVDRSL
ncbi:MAG: hypothetical protein ACRDY3_13425, partial [Acidimicrobiales bacterium]